MVVTMTDKPLTPKQIIIAEWRAKDAALVEAVEEVTIDWKAIAQAHNDSLVERIEENRVLRDRDGELRAENEKAERIAALLAERIKDYRAENERLRESLRIADISINPPDRGGISLAIWNARLAGATSAIRAALRVEESALSAESATYNERWKSKP
jgi:hypothetical protein